MVALHVSANWQECYTIFSTSPILSKITNNLGSGGGKLFLQNKRQWPFILKKNVQRPNIFETH
jgi:hypothetical protein